MTDMTTTGITYNDLLRERDELKKQLDESLTRNSTLLNNYNDAVSKHRADIAKIAEYLHEEAESRNWCDEYDEFLAAVNKRLVFPLPEFEREWDVSATITITGTVRVSALSADEAEDTARDEIGSSVYIDGNYFEVDNFVVDDTQRA